VAVGFERSSRSNGTMSVMNSRRSFDQPVGTLLERQRYVETECIGSFKIDEQFEFHRGLNGKFARLLTLENAIGVARRATKIINLIVSVG
jgi:hypothetical protein